MQMIHLFLFINRCYRNKCRLCPPQSQRLILETLMLLVVHVCVTNFLLIVYTLQILCRMLIYTFSKLHQQWPRKGIYPCNLHSQFFFLTNFVEGRYYFCPQAFKYPVVPQNIKINEQYMNYQIDIQKNNRTFFFRITLI